jgi:type I restriction enzyme S subunit
MIPWPSYRLNELGFVGRGRSTHRPRDHSSLYGGNIPFFQTGDVKAAGFWLRDHRQSYNATGLAQSKLWPRGTLCITIAANIAETAILAVPGAFPDSVVGFVADPQRADVRFVKYSLDILRAQMQGISRGTTQDNLSLDKLLSFSLKVPPLREQRRIAGILSAYDDLIENCERRIRVLDKMARALYREWFVNFRYPGHERVPLVESRVGNIPKGWWVGSIGGAASFLSRGISPVYADDGPSIVINQRCIRDSRLDLGPARRQSRSVPDEKRVRVGDVLINSTGVGTLGRAAQVLEDLGACTVDTHVTIVRHSRSTDPAFFGLALLGLQEEFERKAIGATGQTELGRAAIGTTPLVVPTEECQRAFGQLVSPMRANTLLLQKRIHNLRKTRDLLLPRLLSGQLSVGSAP